MNLFSRSISHVPRVPVEQQQQPAYEQLPPKPALPTLEGLIAEERYQQYCAHQVGEIEARVEHGGGAKNEVVAMHQDVLEKEGCIVIPCKELPDNWNDIPDAKSLRSMDRSFVFPGEQVHVLAFLSARKPDTEIITPFKLAAAMNKNGLMHSPTKQNGKTDDENDALSTKEENSPDSQGTDRNGETLSDETADLPKDVSASESLLRMEDQRRQTEMLLQRFDKSHFFVRIADSDESLWSRKGSPKKSSESSGMDSSEASVNETHKRVLSQLNSFVDKGNFDPNISGGVARNNVKCCSLSNGDIVVLLQVNVGVDFLNDPVIEILQFEKSYEGSLFPEARENLVNAKADPCGELLNWLLPLDNVHPSPARSLSPPVISNSGVGNAPQNPSGSQIFSHFRSYSMSSVPQNNTPPPAPINAASSKPSFDLNDWDQFSFSKLLKYRRTGYEGLLSFRGMSLERERFSVRCGLEGIYIPGRKWRRKLEIIQPVEIHSFAVDCNTDDLLCVQIKNVSPKHASNIVVYVDAINIVSLEASKGGQSVSLPIVCVEAGADHSLPNLALRRGEEHSFILKPATSWLKNFKTGDSRSTRKSLAQAGHAASNSLLGLKTAEGKRAASTANQYAIMVSCRCNYTESRLFFKQPTSWRPRISRDLMISVAPEVSEHASALNAGVSQLPVQVVTLQASNLTNEDLTLTVLAPASFTSPPSLVTLNSCPSMNTFVGFSGFIGKITADRRISTIHRLNSAPSLLVTQKKSSVKEEASVKEKASPVSEVVPDTGLDCTHLWLHSRLPVGRVPSQSTATIKLELLPLTDGIITLDTLKIHINEKGRTYIPEHSLKINATSRISSGIF